MAELTLFGYRPGNSLVHRLDSRFKLVFLFLLSMGILTAAPWHLAVLTLFCAVLMRTTGLSLVSVCKELRYFFILLALIFISRALTTPGLPWLTLGGLVVTRQGVAIGTVVCWRILLVIGLGLLLISATRTSEIRAALTWLLEPVPFIPAARVSTMISLIVRFIPVIFNQMRETDAAQQARGIGNRKNPMYRLKKFAIPLMQSVFRDADKLIDAMESRCYTEKRTVCELVAHKIDWIGLLVVSGVSFLIFFW
jgi:energy-coupling factor transporter transmembrane protein EcfT